MDWSPQQVTALDRVGQWIKAKPKDQPVFLLAGYAGTGKTTLARYLTESIDGLVYFAAYTGKAAHVLSKSGCRNVSTIHKLIYQPKDKSQQKLKELEAERAKLRTHNPVPRELLAKVEKAIETERDNLARPLFQLQTESPLLGARLLVLDEYSMIDEQMGEDLLSFGCPILALGDPGQLPPVRGKPFFSRQPDMLLTEIHRQARDNPIIRLATEVREGRPIRPGSYGSSRAIPYGRLPIEELRDMVLSTDQLLVGKNATRISSNSRARTLAGKVSAFPLEGDKLVCLRNNHDLGLLNGQIWYCTQDAIDDGEYALLYLRGEDGARIEVTAHKDYFQGREPAYWARKDAEEFDYGYALTVHKSQGSQWDNVLLFDEWYGKDRQKWLYTAVTRAAERLDLVMM